MRAIAKAVDLGVSFIIGYASDSTSTSFGRRMPYIIFGSLVAPVSMWFLAAPPQELNLNTAGQDVMSDSSGYRPYNEVTPPPEPKRVTLSFMLTLLQNIIRFSQRMVRCARRSSRTIAQRCGIALSLPWQAQSYQIGILAAKLRELPRCLQRS